jgi:hypothetical protein
MKWFNLNGIIPIADVKNITQEQDKVELLRAGSVVSSFAGAFGASLRETRLTGC